MRNESNFCYIAYHFTMRIAVTLIFISFISALQAQDSVYVSGKKQPLVCYVSRITKNIVVVKPDTLHNSKADTLSTGYITKVVLKGGVEVFFKKTVAFYSNDTLMIRSNSSTLKMDVPFCVPNRLSLSFETMAGKASSIEISAGWVNTNLSIMRINDDDNYSEIKSDYTHGFYGIIGYKILLSAINRSPSPSYWHKLTGAYLRPEINFSMLNITRYGEYEEEQIVFGPTWEEYTEKFKQKSIALSFNYGYQSVERNRLVFDIYVGAGVSWASNQMISTTFPPPLFVISHRYLNRSPVDMFSYITLKNADISPMLQFGVKCGLALGRKKSISVNSR